MSVAMGNSNLQGKNVVVTGAGSGIGKAAALEFARQGASVVVADIRADTAEVAVKEILDEGGTAFAVIGDLTDQSVIDNLVATATSRLGGIDVLVANAGVADSLSATGEVTDAEWDNLIGVNLTAPFKLTRAVLPGMLEQARGSIIYTCSEAGLRGSAAGTAYTVAKHGIVGLTKSAAIMYRDKGIRVNAVAPGYTETGLTVTPDPAMFGPGVVVAYTVPVVGRAAQPDQIAAVIVFLASDAASNISGVVLPVDTGWSAA
jgi:NAD(P)-dependent dehydrogenase (short-subunit alcohol dehydrogenase family)